MTFVTLAQADGLMTRSAGPSICAHLRLEVGTVSPVNASTEITSRSSSQRTIKWSSFLTWCTRDMEGMSWWFLAHFSWRVKQLSLTVYDGQREPHGYECYQASVQVCAIAEVTKAVACGRLTEKITVRGAR
jgi:hypothetical protein